MRSFSTILATASLIAFGTAQSALVERDGTCMSASEAQQVATNFKTLISDYSDEFANQTLTVDFNDYSDSVTSLIDSGCTGPQPLGSVTFDSRAAFEAGQGSQPNIPFEQLNIWNSCNGVFIRWRTALTPEFVTGIIVIDAEQNTDTSSDQPWLIKTVYSEFNSGAWLVDLGVFTPSCSTKTEHRRALRA